MDSSLQEKLSRPLKIQTNDLVDLLGESSSGTLPANEFEIIRDTRAATKASVLFCYAGVSFDPHTLLDKTFVGGLGALVCERAPNVADCDTPIWVVEDARKAWALCCLRSQNNPEKRLSHWGVTGTNGKTSVTQMLSAILKQAGEAHTTLGTLGASLTPKEAVSKKDGWSIKTSHTTPDPDYLAVLLKEASSSGAKLNVMEVASQSLLHQKLSGLKFSALAFTSFSQDHLDLHGSMQEYFEAKMQFFIRYAEADASMYIHASVYEKFMESFLPHLQKSQRVCAYGLEGELAKLGVQPELSVCLKRTNQQELSVAATAKGQTKSLWELVLPNQTHYDSLSLANLACAVAMARDFGFIGESSSVDTNQIQVRGRFEKIAAGKSDGPHVFVDYAHTPDALEKVLLNGRQYLKQIKASEAAKLWVVFGCGGDRDKAKRPLMGRSAAQNADVVVVTSDNPRSESPDSIIADIVAGLDADQFVIEPDREKAIFHALEHAAQDDCVIIAGKGHETEQIVGDQVIAFDDAEKVQQWLLENKPKG